MPGKRKRPLFKYDKKSKTVFMNQKVLREFRPRLKELSKVSKSWYWLYQCAKAKNYRQIKKAKKAFFRAWEREQREEGDE